jgi:hypothetical protein
LNGLHRDVGSIQILVALSLDVELILDKLHFNFLVLNQTRLILASMNSDGCTSLLQPIDKGYIVLLRIFLVVGG